MNASCNSPRFSRQTTESPEHFKAEFNVCVCQLFHAPSIPPAKATNCLWLYLYRTIATPSWNDYHIRIIKEVPS